MKIIIPAILLITLAGCATKPVDQYGQCIDTIAANSKYAALGSKIALGRVSNQTIAMLADTSRIAPEDKPMLLNWSNDKNICVQQDAENRSKLHPKVRQLVEATESASSSAAADLYAGKISYGEFATKRKAGYDAFRSEIASLQTQEIESREVNKRQALMMEYNALQNKPAPAQMVPYQMPIPSRTICNTVSGQTICQNN